MTDILKCIRSANKEFDSIISTINIARVAMNDSEEKIIEDIPLFLSHLWTSCCELQGRYDNILSEFESKGGNENE